MDRYWLVFGVQAVVFIKLIALIARLVKQRRQRNTESDRLHLPAPDSFPHVLYRAIMAKDLVGVRAAFEMGKSQGFSEDQGEALLNLFGLNWHSLHQEIVEILCEIRYPLALRGLYQRVVEPPDYLEGSERDTFVSSCVGAIRAIGGIEAYRVLTDISEQIGALGSGDAVEQMQNWSRDASAGRYPILLPDPGQDGSMQGIEAMCLLRAEGNHSVLKWARQKFIQSELSESLSDLGILNQLSYEECEQVIGLALDASNLPFPEDELSYLLMREQYLLRSYANGELSGARLLAKACSEFLMLRIVDSKFHFWGALDSEIDMLEYKLPTPVNDASIEQCIESELLENYMLPRNYSCRYQGSSELVEPAAHP